MHLFRFVILGVYLISLPACSTLNESLTLGGTIGAVGGASATYAAQSTAPARYKHDTPTTENVLAGAGIGLAVGLLTSYFVHGKVVDDRNAASENGPEMYFGDLPPSPFVFPKNSNKENRQ